MKPARARLLPLLSFGATMLALAAPAILNGGPFVNEDSNTQVEIALTHVFTHDKVMTYGLLLDLFGMGSFWIAVLLNTALTAAALSLLHLALTDGRGPAWGTPVAVLALVFTTGLGVCVGMISADWAVAASAAATLAFLLMPVRRPREAALAWGVALVCTSIHSSGPTVLMATLLLAAPLWGWARRRSPDAIRRGLAAITIPPVAWILVSSLHLAAAGEFRFHKGGPGHMISTLTRAGILWDYLHENCTGDGPYTLCKYKDALPQDVNTFFYNPDVSPILREGGHEAVADEYRAIMRDILWTPRYWPRLAGFAIGQARVQMGVYAIEMGASSVGPGFVLTTIARLSPDEWERLRRARQFSEGLAPIAARAPLERGIIRGAVILYIVALAALYRRRSGAWRAVREGGVFTALFLATNAAACATLSMVHGRFQGRVIWLWAFVALAASFNLISKERAEP